MSWLYSQALVEEYLADTSSDGAPSAPSSVTPMPRAYCSPDKMTDVSRLSRFGMTFAPLTDDRGEDLLMWLREDFLARTSASQEKGQDLAENGPGFGLKCLELLGRFDPDSCSWKTPQLSLVEAESALLQTLPRWGIAADGELWQLQMSELRTSGNASGLWPTPTSSEGTKIPATANYGQIGLNNHPRIRGLPTRPKGEKSRKWATPTAHNSKEAGSPAEFTRNTPTLTAQAHGGIPTQPMPLNPVWVEWLMGWPLGWTDFAPLEMDKFQQWLQLHSLG